MEPNAHVIVVHTDENQDIHIHVSSVDDPDRWEHVGDKCDECVLDSDMDDVEGRIEALQAKYNTTLVERSNA